MKRKRSVSTEKLQLSTLTESNGSVKVRGTYHMPAKLPSSLIDTALYQQPDKDSFLARMIDFILNFSNCNKKIYT